MNAIEGRVAEIVVVSIHAMRYGSYERAHLSIGTNFDGSIDMLREFERLMPVGGGADAMFDDEDDGEVS